MGKKQLKYLLILLIVMGVVAVVLTMNRSGEVEKSISVTDREDLITDFPINDVAELKIESGEEVVELIKGDKGWTVKERDDYPAKIDPIVNFLKMIWALKIVQNVDVGESSYARLHLASSEGSKDKKEGQVEKTIHFKDKEGKILHTLLLGKTYERMDNRPGPAGRGPGMSAVGRYARIAGEDGVFLVGETFKNTDTDPAKWLDEEFFKVEHIKAIEIKTGKKENDWKLTRNKVDQEFVLADVKKDEEYDPKQANALKNAFVSPRFEDVIVGDKAIKKPSKTTFLIDTAAGFHYVVKVSDKNDLNEYFLTIDVNAKLDDKRAAVKGESEEDKKKNDEEFEKAVNAQKKKLAFEKTLSGKVFKVRSYVIDTINKKRADLMKKAGPPAGAQPGGMPGGFPGGGAGGLPPGFKLPPGVKLPPGMKLPPGLQLPGGHPAVKKAAVSTQAQKPKAAGAKKPAVKAPESAPPSEVKKEAKGEAEKPAPKKSGE